MSDNPIANTTDPIDQTVNAGPTVQIDGDAKVADLLGTQPEPEYDPTDNKLDKWAVGEDGETDAGEENVSLGDDSPAHPSTPKTFTQEEYDRVVQESMGRKGQIDKLRDARRDSDAATQQMMGRMQQDVQRLQEHVDPAPTAEDGISDEVLQDPAVQYLARRMDGLENRAYNAEKRAYDTDVQARQQQAVNGRVQDAYNRVKASQDSFSQAHPDYTAAYDHLRGAQVRAMKRQGFTDQQVTEGLDTQQVGFIQMCMQQGIDPATEIYTLAKESGYVPKAGNGNGRVDTTRIQAGVENQSMSEMSGGGSDRDPDTMSLEAFYKNVSHADRIRLMSNHPEVFEQAARTNRVTLPPGFGGR